MRSKIFLSSDKKARTASALVAHNGLRLKSIGNYRGDDGLMVRDLPELRVEGDAVWFDMHACSAIVTPKRRMKDFIRATNVGDIIRSSIRKAGYSWRPYVLRSFFDTQLMLAESKGLVLRDYRQFRMGHKGDIENRYTTNKGRLTENVIEDMREAYRRSQEYLQTSGFEKTSKETLRDELRHQLLLVAGFSDDEVTALDPSMDDKTFQEIVRRKLLGYMVNRGNSQRVVHVRDVEEFLGKGWDFVAKLTDDKAILKLSLKQQCNNWK